jgi:hypothetical protein
VTCGSRVSASTPRTSVASPVAGAAALAVVGAALVVAVAGWAAAGAVVGAAAVAVVGWAAAGAVVGLGAAAALVGAAAASGVGVAGVAGLHAAARPALTPANTDIRRKVRRLSAPLAREVMRAMVCA